MKPNVKIGIYQAANFENFFEKLLTPTHSGYGNDHIYPERDRAYR